MTCNVMNVESRGRSHDKDNVEFDRPGSVIGKPAACLEARISRRGGSPEVLTGDRVHAVAPSRNTVLQNNPSMVRLTTQGKPDTPDRRFVNWGIGRLGTLLGKQVGFVVFGVCPTHSCHSHPRLS